MTVSATVRLAEDPGFDAHGPSIGKDLLELLSSAMYEDPLTLYREYIQNAADSIDQAREAGTLSNTEGSIEIKVDPRTRNVRIRDDGAGIGTKSFASRMRSVGSSTKRGTAARGFRGVGRLSGLAYAQRVIFRSRSSAAENVQQITWDCRKLRAGLKDSAQLPLSEFIQEITDLQELEGEWPERFFEVELAGVVRQGDDRLVRPETVADYIAQVAPVPFAPDFKFGGVIVPWTEVASPVHIRMNEGEPILRHHRELIQPVGKPAVHLRELETFEVPGLDGGVAARGWVAHHDYYGAIPVASLKGLRVRVGDIQVGSSTLLEDVFPEPRFGAWAIGEVHVLDRRIIPNGRRDGFEQNVHFANLLNHLAPRGREIAKRCRTQSSARQRKRAFEAQAVATEQLLGILEEQALPPGARTGILNRTSAHIDGLEKIANSISWQDDQSFQERSSAYRQRFVAASESPNEGPLQHLSSEGRELIERVVSLIYERSKDPTSAREIVDHILIGLS